MKVVSARKLEKYSREMYERAGIYKWIAENCSEVNKLERDSAFMAEFVAAVNSRLTAAKTAQRRAFYEDLLEEMTDALCSLNKALNHERVRHDRAQRKAAKHTSQLPKGWRWCSHWREVIKNEGVRAPFASDAMCHALCVVSAVVFACINKCAVHVISPRRM